MATDFNKAVRKVNKSTQKNLKRSVKQAKKQAKKARKGAEKTYKKLNFEQKAAFYGGFVVFVAVLSFVFSRATK